MTALNSVSAVRLATEVRSAVRRLGLVPYINRARLLLHRVRGTPNYEAHFGRALMGSVQQGETVWDVGANVGFYTTRLSDSVGPSGLVVAFEPVPSCFDELVRRTSNHTNVRAIKCALSSQSGTAPMSKKSDPLSPTNSLLAAPGEATVHVPVAVARELVESGRVPPPNVVKIDVEGFEEEVLEGFGELLRAPTCRAVFVEVHFAVLDQRGRRQAPARISDLLQGAGFKIRWVDSSHLEALRS